MPITVPDHLLERYGDRVDHFEQIYSALISPAIVEAGLTAISPARHGSVNIQAGVINDLEGADMVLADLSGMNPNVFLELGIRSALDRPVCLIWDGLDTLQFDSGTLNTHKYAPTPAYELNDEIQKLAGFIEATCTRTDGRNELWKFFGSASANLPVAELDPADASLHAKVDRILELFEHQPRARSSPPVERLAFTGEDRELVASTVTDALIEAGSAGLHGTRVGRMCRALLGSAYDDFIGGGTLSSALGRCGVALHTNGSGQFFYGSRVGSPPGDPPSIPRS